MHLINCITADATKFHTVVAAIDSNVLEPVYDIIETLLQTYSKEREQIFELTFEARFSSCARSGIKNDFSMSSANQTSL